MSIVTINVQLLNEGVEVWRPVQAEDLGNGLYQLLPDTNDHFKSREKWEFLPGSIVRGEIKMLYEGISLKSSLVAVRL